ncbi:arsenic resistance N-acetyltransferase ArsN2 [Qipengyuania flava]|uniref:arsenic resistance N-acetyltransferase ArsN2 n=1 Tax=Qipengyuania flava TaxID=192812 RepID=UPI00273F5FEE|nr:arsenic resistance N-acetyltransferase ArsN2 [Qipengyuania flava]
MTTLSITPAVANEQMIRALAAEGLPVEDLAEEERSFFAFHDGPQWIGFGGIEGDGPDRILRSLVISGTARGKGTGAEAVALLESEARRDGAARLHLLTTTAGDFFRKLGYRDCSRDEAPERVASSREFAALCPASADYLVKRL